MTKIIKLRGPIREFMVAVGAYSRGGLLIICSSRVRAYWRGGGAMQGFTVSYFCVVNVSDKLHWEL